MKAVVTLLALVLASCTMDAPPEVATSASEQHATTRALPQVDTTCQWVRGGSCYGLPNDGNNIWPAGIGITRLQVLLRGGPPRLGGKQQTFLAFVMWNSTTVGRIYRLDLGSADAASWRAALDNIVAGRTFNIFDSQAGSTGSTVGTPTPPPHPNVDGEITFEQPYLDVLRRETSVIDDATAAILGAKSIVID